MFTTIIVLSPKSQNLHRKKSCQAGPCFAGQGGKRYSNGESHPRYQTERPKRVGRLLCANQGDLCVSYHTIRRHTKKFRIRPSHKTPRKLLLCINVFSIIDFLSQRHDRRSATLFLRSYHIKTITDTKKRSIWIYGCVCVCVCSSH